MRFFVSVLILVFGLLSFGGANAQYKSPGPVGAQSTIRECTTGQGMKQHNTSCRELTATIFNMGDRNYINQPLHVGTDYPFGFNYSTRDVWSVCRETDGRSSLINGTYCKIIQGENVNYWVPGVGPMRVRWDTDFKNETGAPTNTYFYKLHTVSLSTDMDWETNKARQNQICNRRGFANAIGTPLKLRYEDVVEGGEGAVYLAPTDPSATAIFRGQSTRLARRLQYHLILCDATAYLARQQAIAKPFD